jgi:hypothetical protein
LNDAKRWSAVPGTAVAMIDGRLALRIDHTEVVSPLHLDLGRKPVVAMNEYR